MLRFAGEPDRLAAQTGCPPDNRDAVRGNAYVRVRSVPIAPSQTQLLVHPSTVPFRFLDSQFEFDGPRDGLSAQPVYPDGGLGLAIPLGYGSIDFFAAKPPVDAFEVGDSGMTEPFGVRLNQDGGLAWYLFDVGPISVDPCHPAVRATYGGHVGRAVGQLPGSDFALRYMGAWLRYQFPDVDRDGFKAADAGRWDGWYSGDGLEADAGDDCNDSDVRVHPGAEEFCDGIDTDCNGVADDLARIRLIPKCDRQQGVCLGASHLVADCIAGDWAACPASRYGPAYSTLERCDGLDNDCDGLVDGAEPSLSEVVPCPLQQGVCAGATHLQSRCAPTNGACATTDYGAGYQTVETACDGVDNDCDGLRDEGCNAAVAPKACGCAASPGTALAAFLLIASLRRRRSLGARRLF